MRARSSRDGRACGVQDAQVRHQGRQRALQLLLPLCCRAALFPGLMRFGTGGQVMTCHLTVYTVFLAVLINVLVVYVSVFGLPGLCSVPQPVRLRVDASVPLGRVVEVTHVPLAEACFRSAS